MTNEQLNVKYVDLQGLRLFAEELKKWLKSHVVETDIYKELLYRIENLELYKIVETLPEEGDEDTIYLLRNPNEEDKNHFIEYLYSKEHGWEEIGKFIPDIKLEEYLKIQDSPFEKGEAENSAVLRGGNNIATGLNSYAEGGYTKALSEVAHAEGLKTISGRISQLIDPTTGSIRELTNEEISTLVNEALRIGLITSQNEFNNDVAMKLIGVASHSEGSKTKALGTSSHAEGNNTEASSNSSHAEGDSTHAWGEASHAEGYLTEANGNQSHSEGKQTKAQGNSSHAEGIETQANGWGSHAEGQNTVASGDMSHAQGIDTIASGARSFATGDGTIAKGAQSIVGGYKSKSAGDSAISIGHRTYAKGQDSICMGISNHEVNTYESKTNEEILAGVKDGSIVASIALGNQSQAIGGNVFAYGSQAHAEGWRTKAIGNHSHAEGNYSIAEGNNSYAGGNYCNANGTASFATGDHTKTTNANEAAFGKYNKSESNTLFSVGNGTLDTDRKNAFEVKQNGDVYITGIGGFTGANSDSAKSVQEVINELVNKLNEITTND